MSEEVARRFRAGKLIAGLAAGLLASLLLLRWVTDLYVELLWFRELGYTDVFWTRAAADWGVRIVAALLTGGLVYLNLRLASTTLGRIQVRRRFGDLEIQEQLPESYVRWGVGLVAVLVALWFAAAVSEGAGVRALLILRGEAWGIAEPFFGQDAAFYVYWLPALSATLTFGLVLAFFLFALAAVGYAATGAIRWNENRLDVEHLPRVHLGILGGSFLFLLAARFWVARYLLLLDGNSGVQGIFGYADEAARIPGYQALAGLVVLAGAAVIWGSMRRRVAVIAGGVGGAVLGTLILVEAYPALIQRFQVQPNELARETPYIQHALEFTHLGFALDGMERSELDYRPVADEDWDQAMEQFDGLPIWTRTTLLATFRQIEARFPYYDFHDVAIDRYPASDQIHPVAVSVREVDQGGIPDPNWQNLHLRERYVVGHGAVAAAAARMQPNGQTSMFLTGIPPRFTPGPGVPEQLDLERASVFVGSRPQRYAVLNPSEESFLAPDGSAGEPSVDFPEGIPLSSLTRTLAMAWQFRDANLLLAGEIQPTSRFVFRRGVAERVRAVAPFLDFLEPTYPVVHEGRLIWILDGFTTSRHFPVSQAHEIGARRAVSWIRNSVKATVDAVTGEVDLYAVDADDPLLQGYRRVFPGLFREGDEMPGGLRDHLRYPRELMNLQSVVLSRYHQEDPPVFHGQQDRWSLATQLGAQAQSVTYLPEYGVWRRPGEEEADFHLSTVFVPAGRQNLASKLVARWDPQEGPRLYLYDVPVAHQFRGPRQIGALVEQDPVISQQFSLWRQGGSQVWTGHLHLVPVGRSLLYMEPVFLAADEDAIPEIRRYIVSDGWRVAMEPTLEEAVEAVQEGLVAVVEDPEGELDPPPAALPAAQEVAATGSREALELLQEAEERLRVGDWSGFGSSLERLRIVLEQMAGEPGQQDGFEEEPLPDGR